MTIGGNNYLLFSHVRLMHTLTNPMRSLKTLISLILITAWSNAQEKTQASVQATRIDGNITLTGKLDHARWMLAQPIEINYEIMPAENTPAPQKTTVKILYNAEYIYFGFNCEDTKLSEIRANVSDRDKIFDDDFVIIFLDTYGDKQRTYEFAVNPYGVQADLMRSGNNEDASFDAIWYSAAAINEHGWTAELAIPFKSLRFPSIPEQTWNVLLGRNYPRASRAIFSLTPFDRNNPCLPCQGVILQGIKNIEATTALELIPYFVGSSSGSLNDEEDPVSGFENHPVMGRVGGGVKYSPDPGLLIEGVLNPDFSQVESDAGQISVNTTFALFYPEKRPFFLEGSDLFQNRTNIFYSRTINNPLGALKLSGKSGVLSFSYLAAADRNTAYIIPGEEESDFESSEHSSFSNIARMRYDLGNESFLGGMLTTRNSDDAHNYVGGVDWNYFFGGNYYFRGELFYSNTKELNDLNVFSTEKTFGSTGKTASFDGETYSGTSFRVDLRREARDYGFNVSYRETSPTFQAQQGFVTSNNDRFLTINQTYTLYPTNSFIDRADINIEAGLHFNHDGIKKERWLGLFGGVQMKSQTNIFIGTLLVNEELFKGVYFPRLPRLMVNINSQPSRLISGNFQGQFGHFIYREDAPELGTGHNMSLQITLRPTNRFQLDLSYVRARLSSVATQELFYDGYIARTAATYQFTPEFFLRMIGQYNSFDKVVDLYPLFSYKLNPFTIFYVGSTSSMTEFDQPHGFKQTSRQFFLKLQYLWRS